MEPDSEIQRSTKLSVGGVARRKSDLEKGTAVTDIPVDQNATKQTGTFTVHTPTLHPIFELDIVVIRSRTAKDASKPKQEPQAGDKPDGTSPRGPEPQVRRSSKEGRREGKHGGPTELLPMENDWLTTASMLPSAMPTARIMEFYFPPDAVIKQKGSTTISHLANQFLEALERHRESCPKRPIIYIVHENGGEILRVAFESHVETYLGPRYEMERLKDLKALDDPPPSPPPPGSPVDVRKFLGPPPALSSPHYYPPPPRADFSPPPLPPDRYPFPHYPPPPGWIPPPARRESEESERSWRSLQVPIFHTDSLRIVIGVIFLEYNPERETRTGFLKTLAERGVPVRWFIGKRHRGRTRLPMFPEEFMNMLELEIPTPGALNKFANTEDEENYGRVRREIQQMATCDALLDAAYRNDTVKIKELVAQRLHPDRPRANGKLALHIATRLGHVETIETLLAVGADITSKTVTGETALRIAAELHDPKVVKLLLEKGAPTDVFDNEGFDFSRFIPNQRRLASDMVDPAASEEERKKAEEEKSKILEVCALLLSPPLAEGPSQDGHSRKFYPQNEPPLPPSNFGQDACRAYGITVAEFFTDRPEISALKDLNCVQDHPMPIAKEFRIIRSHSVHKTLYTNVLQKSSAVTRTQVENKLAFTWYHIPANNTAWVEGLFVRLGIQDWLEIDAQEQRGTTPHSRVMMAGTNKLDNNSNQGNISLFAPFLNVELTMYQRRMARWIRKTKSMRYWYDRGAPPRPYNLGRKAPEKYLINAYLNEDRGLHIRRTLDQSHYSMLPNTDERDKDQVLQRHMEDGPPAVVMVDQLWLWIIDDILITSFPLRMDQSDGRDVLDSILKYVRSKDRKPIFKPHDLATIIIERCTGVLTSANNRSTPGYNIVDIFGSAIGKVSNEETTLMKKFHANVLKLTNLRASFKMKKRSRMKYSHFDDTSEYSSYDTELSEVSSYESSSMSDSSRPWRSTNSSSNAAQRRRLRRHQRRARKDPKKLETRLLNSFNNIAQETTQLIEIKDIKDELGMLIEVLSSQQQAIKDYSLTVSPVTGKSVLPQTVTAGEEQLHRLRQMSEQSEDIFKSLNHLLDLKQKQANAAEARTANVQAMQADKQGKTLMVFTTVTIIFLPLSFMAAFFAMPVVNFPRNLDGTSALTLAFVSKFIFPISIAISIPFLVLAFSVNNISNSFSDFQRRANAAAFTPSRYYGTRIAELTGWERRKAQMKWFFPGLWRWYVATFLRPFKLPRAMRRWFKRLKIGHKTRKVKRKARAKGLWKKRRNSIGEELSSDTWSRATSTSSRSRSLVDD